MPGLGRRAAGVGGGHGAILRAAGYSSAMRLTLTDRLWLAVYSLALVLLLPTTLYHLVWRGMRQREYLQRWDERFAFYPTAGEPGGFWLHAVSVGEVNAAAPLVRALRAKYPETPLLLTTVTPTGSRRARELFGEAVRHAYLPYDTPGAVRHFLDHFRPRLALVLETELWPNLYVETARLLRATDKNGVEQTGVEADVLPDGATGWHSVDFSVHG